MTRRCIPPLIAVALALTGCGGDDAASIATPSPVPTQANATCDEVAYNPVQGTRFVHPSQNFYAPGDPGAPGKDDIQHLLLADNAVVVSYPAATSAAGREQLREWASEQVATVVVPDSTAGAPPVTAMIATAKLTCDGLDTEQLTAFAAKRGTGTTAPHPDEG